MEHTVRPAGGFLVILHSGLGAPEGGGWGSDLAWAPSGLFQREEVPL